LRDVRLLLALCALVFVSGCDGSMFDDVPWWHWVLLLLIGVVAVAAQIALIVLYVWVVIRATRRFGRLRAAAKSLTPVDYLLWGAIGAVPGAIGVGALIVRAMGGGSMGDVAAALCGAGLGAGVAIFLARRRHSRGLSQAAVELAGYVHQCRERGQDDESITQTLRASGWGEEAIDEALRPSP
jgi:hypothetical protein